MACCFPLKLQFAVGGLLLSFTAGVLAQTIFENSFESLFEYGEILLETTVEPGETQSTPGGELSVEVTGDSPASVEVTEVIFSETGLRGFELSIVGGDAVIRLPEPSSDKDRPAETAKGGFYPLIHKWPLDELKCFGRYENVNWARSRVLSEQCTHYTSNPSSPLTTIFLERPGVQLWSSCPRDQANCTLGDPVLFIHGYQPEPGIPDIYNNGGESYWGLFPNVLISFGFAAFEFRWITDAPFGEVAVDLADAIESINATTGKKVHIVAHSFGGVVVRSLLQHVEPVTLGRTAEVSELIATVTTIGTPHSGIASSNSTFHGQDFPKGRDGLWEFFFEFCFQISCHLMGEDVLGADTTRFFGLSTEPGELAATLATTIQELPEVDIQVLLSFTRKRILDFIGGAIDFTVGDGDDLISGWGQRFHPDLSVERIGASLERKWEPLLALPSQPSAENPRVAEFILGRPDPNDPDLQLEPGQSQESDQTFVPMAHSRNTEAEPYEDALRDNSPGAHYVHLQPFVGVEGVTHDAVQRVLDWARPIPASPSQPSPADTINLETIPLLLTWAGVENSSFDEFTTFDVYLNGQLVGMEVPENIWLIAPSTVRRENAWQVVAKHPRSDVLGPEWTFAVPALPGEATNPVPSDGSVFSQSPTVLDWDDAVNATNYDVVLDGGEIANGIEPSEVQLDAVLSPGVHTWFVRSSNDAGSAVSQSWTFTIDSSLPHGSSKDCNECPLMVDIPGGIFDMGDTSGSGNPNELPVRQVTVPAFAAGVFEVTWDEWHACVNDSRCTAGRSDAGWGQGSRPVIDVSWNDAKDYVAWLSSRTGQQYRLLSEAEWEYVARAGTNAPYWWGSEDPAACDTNANSGANYNSCKDRTDPVGLYSLNPFGIFDLNGNVYEWVEDCYNETYDGAPTDGSAWLAGDCNLRAQRGGSRASSANELRSAARNSSGPLNRGINRGFRVAKALTDSFTLTVQLSGSGSGNVTSNPGAISCPDACSETYGAGQVVGLTATPNTGSVFSGWDGACSGAGVCAVSMGGAVSVTAEFDVEGELLIQDLVFADSALEACVQESATANGWLEVSQVDYLWCNDRGILLLDGLEQLTELQSLSVYSNQIADISPLSSLTKLNYAMVSWNQVADLSPLEPLTQIETLLLSGNQISDVAPLASLLELDELWLDRNEIVDISPLSSLVRLERLFLSRNQIEDVGPLSSLSLIRELWFGSNQVADISALEALGEIEILRVETNQIFDISPLSSLTRLRNLSVIDNDVSDISPISNLTNLISIDMRRNQIGNIDAVAGLTELETLLLSNNQIIDISPLSELVKLDDLTLSDNQIVDVSALTQLTELATLHLNGNQIVDISPLANLGKIATLYLIDNQIEDISALANMQLLSLARLERNRISDLSPLAGSSNLVDLRVSGNQISDLSALNALTGLGYLYLGGNNISDIAPLSSLSQLIRLEISFNQVIDLAPIAGLTNLTLFGAGQNQISDVSPLSDLTELRSLTLRVNQISDITALTGLTQLSYFTVRSNQNMIPCDQLALFSFVQQYDYDPAFDVDGDGQIVLPPDGVDENCGQY